ncbi:MAG TPA: hypothetical protein VF490_12540, partial [Chryseosolibacter sp.]
MQTLPVIPLSLLAGIAAPEVLLALLLICENTVMMSLESLENLGRRLEPDAAQRKELLAKAESYIEQFIGSLPTARGYSGGGARRLRELEVGEPKPFDGLLEIIREEVDGPGINSASGRHLGYI